jgi:hypothetical protein
LLLDPLGNVNGGALIPAVGVLVEDGLVVLLSVLAALNEGVD